MYQLATRLTVGQQMAHRSTIARKLASAARSPEGAQRVLMINHDGKSTNSSDLGLGEARQKGSRLPPVPIHRPPTPGQGSIIVIHMYKRSRLIIKSDA